MKTKSFEFKLNRVKECAWEASKVTDDPNSFTQRAIAKKIGSNKQSVWDWFNNNRQPTKRYKKKLYTFFSKFLPDLEWGDLFYTKYINQTDNEVRTK